MDLCQNIDGGSCPSKLGYWPTSFPNRQQYLFRCKPGVIFFDSVGSDFSEILRFSPALVSWKKSFHARMMTKFWFTRVAIGFSGSHSNLSAARTRLGRPEICSTRLPCIVFGSIYWYRDRHCRQALPKHFVASQNSLNYYLASLSVYGRCLTSIISESLNYPNG